MWSDWAAGVLSGIGAPATATNLDTLWAWSNKESGADVMRWNNPLNTSWYLPGAVPMNWIPIWKYASVEDGITATVLTLLQPQYYSAIRSNLRNSVPRADWANACSDLETWGTGCGWLQSTFGSAPGNITQGEEMIFVLRNPIDGSEWQVDPLFTAKTLIDGERAKTLDMAAKLMGQPGLSIIDNANVLLDRLPTTSAGGGTVAVDLRPVLAAIADLKAHPVAVADPAVLAIVTKIENALKAA